MRIRIAVAVDRIGAVVACAIPDNAEDPFYAVTDIAEHEDMVGEVYSIVTADVPMPEPPTEVEGSVEDQP